MLGTWGELIARLRVAASRRNRAARIGSTAVLIKLWRIGRASTLIALISLLAVPSATTGQNGPFCPFNPGAAATDTDGDGIPDTCDNCTTVGNASQQDGDADGYGNACDGDLNNSGNVVNFSDLALFRAAFGTANDEADLNASGGVVDFADLAIFRPLFGLPPGPTGLTPRLSNTAPVANAGPDQTALLSQTVTLDGTASTDLEGHRLAHSWRIVTAPAGSTSSLSDPNAVRPTLLVDEDGTYTVELQVTDGSAVSLPDTVLVSTTNSAPVAHAGPDQVASPGNLVTLDAGGSTDVDGDLLTFSWSLSQKPVGSGAVLSDSTAVRPTFSLDTVGDYQADLTVSDGAVSSAPDSVRVTTGNAAPVADAGPDQAVTTSAPVTLDASGSNDSNNDPLTFEWTLPVAPAASGAVLDDPALSGPTFTTDVPGTYVGQLIVDDGTQASAPDTVVISTDNARPVANAGSDVTVETGTPVALNGGAADDGDGDPITYQWALIARPAGSTALLSDPTSVSAGLTPDVAGLYVAQLIVSDGSLDSPPDTVVIQATPVIVADSDGDGLSDALEAQLGTDPNNPDTDGDTLTDGQEVNQYATSPFLVDTDGDSFGDNEEVSAGTDPKSNASTPSTIPPDPQSVAPPTDPTTTTILAEATEFLYTGPNRIQNGVATDTIEPVRAAVVRGRVLDASGQPLSGAHLTIKDHPEFGGTLSRADGMFDMAVNGGGLLTINYTRSGYLSTQRQVTAPWQDFVIADDVMLVPLDSQVTSVSLGAGSGVQIARGSSVTDSAGSRQSTVLFPAGTTGQMVMANGSSQPLSSLHIRATEYTVGPDGPKHMPGPLPATSGYTYAVEFSVDEAIAAGAKTVTFSQALPTYVDNFLNFPIGINVPSAYYDRDKVAWIPIPDGRVIKILSITNGTANVDTTGANIADNGAAIGMTTDERQRLAVLYSAGKSLWRVPVTHFSTYDHNYGVVPPPDSTRPQQPPPQDGLPPEQQTSPEGNTTCGNSEIDCQQQRLRENIPIAGAPFALHYASDRMPGNIAGRTLRIPLSGATVPASLTGIKLEIDVAGRTFAQQFPAAANQSYTFTWDGTNAFGQTVLGGASASVRIGYVYDGFYALPPAQAASFGAASGQQIPGDVLARDGATLWQTASFGLKFVPQSRTGWDLTIHHAYSPTSQALYQGDGQSRSAYGSLRSDYTRAIITTVAGNGTAGFSGNGGPATAAMLTNPRHPALGPDGNLYFGGDPGIRRVGPDGIITTVAGTAAFNIGGVEVAADGALYIIDIGGFRIRRVGSDGIITTVAGNGTSGGSDASGTCGSGDGGPATAATLFPQDAALGPDGSLYIVCRFGSRIRRVGSDGIITTVAGNGTAGFSGDGGPATAAGLQAPRAVALDRDGNLYIAELGRIRRVGPDGIITTVVGDGTAGFGGDGGPATLAAVAPFGVEMGSDSSLYVTEVSRIRRVGPDGIITTVAGNGTAGFSGDGGPATAAGFGAFGPGVVFISNAVAVSGDGSMYIADNQNKRIRRLAVTLPGFSANELNVSSADGAEVYVFDANGLHLRTVNALTGATIYSFAYDAAGRLSGVTDGDGNQTTMERDGSGNPTAIVAPDGQRTTLTVNGQGYLASVTNPAGEQTGMGYATGGLLTSFTNPRGKTSQYTYDSLGRLLTASSVDGYGQTLARADTSTGYQATRTSAMGRTTTYAVENPSVGGQKRTTTFPDGTKTVVELGTNGSTKITLPDGTVSTEVQGGDPRFSMQAPVTTSLITVTGGLTRTEAGGRTAVLATPGDPLSLISLTETRAINGRTATRTYTASTRTRVSTSPAGRTVTTVTDTQGRPITVQVPGLADVSLAYDLRGRLQTRTQGSGPEARTLSLAYNANGYLESATDPEGRTIFNQYDDAGRVTQQSLPGSRHVGFGYDANGNLTSVTPPGRPAHGFTFTDGDLVGTYAPPAVAGGGSTGYSYTNDRQPQIATRPDAKTIALAYDTAGRVATRSIGRGQYAYSYSPITGQLASIAAPADGTLSSEYAGSLLTSVTHTGEAPGAVGFGYDNDFRLTSVTVNGANAVTLGYDADSLLTSAGALTLARNSQNGLLTGTTLGGATDTYTYNSFGEVATFAATFGVNTLYSVAYTRDKLGRITQKQETVQGVSATYNYAYDDAGRLQEAKKDDSVTATYSYDANGNRLSKIGPAISESGTYDDQDRALTYGGAAYSYTANGDLATRTVGGQTSTYDYDELGNLTKVVLADGTQIDYVIDGQNRRVGKKVNGTSVQGFLYQDQLRPVAELDGSGTVVSRFVYGTRVNVPEYMIRGGVSYRIITDQVGSPRLVVNTSTGAVAQRIDFDEFGNVLTDSSPGFQPFGFAGGIYDKDVILSRYGARDYDGKLGRWISKDPILFAAGSANLYSYVENDPLNIPDPSGFDYTQQPDSGYGQAFNQFTSCMGSCGGADGSISGPINMIVDQNPDLVEPTIKNGIEKIKDWYKSPPSDWVPPLDLLDPNHRFPNPNSSQRCF